MRSVDVACLAEGEVVTAGLAGPLRPAGRGGGRGVAAGQLEVWPASAGRDAGAGDGSEVAGYPRRETDAINLRNNGMLSRTKSIRLRALQRGVEELIVQARCHTRRVLSVRSPRRSPLVPPHQDNRNNQKYARGRTEATLGPHCRDA